MLRGEVWHLSAGGQPAGLDALTRLVLILSSDSLGVLPLRVVVPLTPWLDSFDSVPWMVRIPAVLNSGLESAMAADALQVRSVSNARLDSRLGRLPERIVNQVAAAVELVICAPR